MFFNESLLTRKGPLANVWVAAHHMEKKLTKNQLRETSVQASVDTLTGTELPPLALRLTGQLLLGVVVIYSRKARYLLDDCNDAVLRLKITFRPAVVDAPEMNITADLAAITMPALLETGKEGDVDVQVAGDGGRKSTRRSTLGGRGLLDIEEPVDGQSIFDMFALDDPLQAFNDVSLSQMQFDSIGGAGIHGISIDRVADKGRAIAGFEDRHDPLLAFEDGEEAVGEGEGIDFLKDLGFGDFIGQSEVEVGRHAHITRERDSILQPFDNAEAGYMQGPDIGDEYGIGDHMMESGAKNAWDQSNVWPSFDNNEISKLHEQSMLEGLEAEKEEEEEEEEEKDQQPLDDEFVFDIGGMATTPLRPFPGADVMTPAGTENIEGPQPAAGEAEQEGAAAAVVTAPAAVAPRVVQRKRRLVADHEIEISEEDIREQQQNINAILAKSTFGNDGDIVIPFGRKQRRLNLTAYENGIEMGRGNSVFRLMALPPVNQIQPRDLLPPAISVEVEVEVEVGRDQQQQQPRELPEGGLGEGDPFLNFDGFGDYELQPEVTGAWDQPIEGDENIADRAAAGFGEESILEIPAAEPSIVAGGLGIEGEDGLLPEDARSTTHESEITDTQMLAQLEQLDKYAPSASQADAYRVSESGINLAGKLVEHWGEPDTAEDADDYSEAAEPITFQSIESCTANRRAAAGGFFELLVLKTRGLVLVDQPEPMDDITIRPAAKLFQDFSAALSPSQQQSAVIEAEAVSA